jgi:hypothetical protein
MSIAGAKHIIQKQFMEIDFAGNLNGLSVQNELAELFYERLLPRMEMLFDEFGNNDYLICFETLQVDLGNIPSKNWEEALVEETLRALQQELLAADKIKISGGAKAHKTEDALLFFLQQGHLPWNSTILSIKEFEQLSPSIQFAQKLKEFIQIKPVIIDRLINNFSEHFLHAIINVLAEEAIAHMEESWTEEIKPVHERKKAQLALIKMLCAQTDKNEKSSVAVVKKNVQGGTIEKAAETNDEIYVHNAGLIILHPFLPELFKTLSLYNKNEWQDENSRYNAMRVLEYLVTGTDEYLEFNITLNKILCGLEPDGSLKPVLPLSLGIKTECDIMLQVVVQHWSALKNSSVEALRETYLQRFGKLTKTDHGWSLQAEPKSVDVLLGRLPWGISSIRLPWMKTMLFTEWY